jgi:hypothetical protein
MQDLRQSLEQGTGTNLPAARAGLDGQPGPYEMIQDVAALERLYDNFSGLIWLAKEQAASRDVEAFECCQLQIQARIERLKTAASG